VLTVRSSDGVDVAVHDLGGSGPTLLLAHATGFHGRVFTPLASRLSPRFHCFSPDLRGHGVTVTPEGAAYSWDRFGDDVGSVAEAIGTGGPLVGVGHSMGGAALLVAEARRPGTFAGLFLYEPIVLPPVDGDLAMSNPLSEVAARRREVFDSIEAAIANYAVKPPLDALHPDALRAYVEHAFEPRADGTVRLRCRAAVESTVFAMAPTQRVWEHLGGIACPVVVARGNVDAPGPAAMVSSIADALPNGRVEPFDDLGHFGPLEDPDTVAAAISRALLP